MFGTEQLRRIVTAHESQLPERRCARLLIIDEAGRLLLFRYDDGRGAPFWATPGGELLDGESYEEAAARELAEETGYAAAIGSLVRTRDAVYAAGDVPLARWHERYFVVHARAGDTSAARWTQEERRTICAVRWWPLADLRAASELVLPEWLSEAHESLLAGNDTHVAIV